MARNHEGSSNPAWKGDQAKADAGRARARKSYILGLCAQCGQPGSDRHHRDGNTLNNTPENIEILCRRCHMTVDGRLNAFLEMAKQPKPQLRTEIAPCINCKEPFKPLRKGRCRKCSLYFYKHKIERPLEFTVISHCPRGHEYTPENTRIDRKGCKNCRKCRAEDGKKRRDQQKLNKDQAQ